ncbi:phage tail length tape measure family protein, partial [Methylobacterium segetis]|uniref:phage tail length tape measure family protein n=1 Tax=Methylobacterium segetis TaxID=2488750 RepID=UPI001A9EA8BB
MPQNIAIRLQVEGGAEIKRSLEDAGRAGQDAFRQVGTAADQATAATDRLAKKAQEAADAARRVPSAAGGASPSSPASLPPSSPATMREVERLRSQLDEEYRRQKSLNRAEDILGRGYGSGLVDAAERDRLRGLALQRFAGTNDNAPRSRGLDAFQKRDLMYQGGDVVASLGSGAGLGTVAFQQGPQILQGLAAGEGGLRGGLTALGQSAAALVTPFTVAATSATALGAAFLYAGSQAAKDQE